MTQTIKTTLRPLYDRVLVKRLEDGNGTHGSLIIPDSAKEKPQHGEIVAVGSGRTADDGRHMPLTVKRGDHVLFGKYAGSEVTVDGHEYLIMKEEDVLGVFAA
jgi:chaperonin GroES